MTDGRGSPAWRRALSKAAALARSAWAAITAPAAGVFSRLRASRQLRWELAAFGGALLVYAITRFWRLGDYPIYFFTDEAFEPLTAEELLRNGLRDAYGRLFPLYFQNGGAWAPVLSVWAHVVTVDLFGKSVEVARATTAAFTVLGAAAAGLILKFGFRSRIWWTGPLFLATTPAFFLHSRTTFETAFMASFFAGFILFYLLYRCRSPWYLYPAILMGACAFYCYTVGQVVICLSAALLAVVDIGYHFRHWRHVLAGLVLVAITAIPLYQFRQREPRALTGQLSRVSSYWLEKIPVQEKLRHFAREYGRGLSPKYWFFPHDLDLARHTMAGYGHIRKQMLPFFAIGVGVCLWRIRSAPHRTLLICALAAPAGAALAAIGITRTLSFVVPAAILAAVGVGALVELVRNERIQRALGAAVFILLAVSSFQLLADALTHGPRWYTDYGLYGQQWGAKQLFQIIPQYLKADPTSRVALSSDWANGTDLYPRFFFKRDSPDAARVFMGNVRDFSGGQMIPPGTIFVMTPGELQMAKTGGKFSTVQVDRVVNCPDGKPCFYFVRLALSPDIGAIVARERAAQRTLVDSTVVVHGETLAVRHTRFDIGGLENLFDGDPNTLSRFNGGNPAVMEVEFPRPRRIRKIVLMLGSGNWEITATLKPAGGGKGETYSVSGQDRGQDSEIDLPTDKGPAETRSLRLDIHYKDADDMAVVHVREIEFR